MFVRLLRVVDVEELKNAMDSMALAMGADEDAPIESIGFEDIPRKIYEFKEDTRFDDEAKLCCIRIVCPKRVKNEFLRIEMERPEGARRSAVKRFYSACYAVIENILGRSNVLGCTIYDHHEFEVKKMMPDGTILTEIVIAHGEFYVLSRREDMENGRDLEVEIENAIVDMVYDRCPRLIPISVAVEYVQELPEYEEDDLDRF